MTRKILVYFRLLRTIRGDLGTKNKIVALRCGNFGEAFPSRGVQIGAIALQFPDKLAPRGRLVHCGSFDLHSKQMAPQKLHVSK